MGDDVSWDGPKANDEARAPSYIYRNLSNDFNGFRGRVNTLQAMPLDSGSVTQPVPEYARGRLHTAFREMDSSEFKFSDISNNSDANRNDLNPLPDIKYGTYAYLEIRKSTVNEQEFDVIDPMPQVTFKNAKSKEIEFITESWNSSEYSYLPSQDQRATMHGLNNNESEY